MAENIKLAEFNIDVDDVVKSASELKKAIDEIKEAQKQARAEGKADTIQYVENEAVLKSLNAEYRQHIKALSDNINATVDSTNRNELLNAVLNEEVVSIQQAREQNKLLNKLRNESNLATEEGRSELELLNKTIDANNDFIKENVDALSQQKIGIGNYKDGIIEAMEEMRKNKEVLEQNKNTLIDLRNKTEKGSSEWVYYNNQINQTNTQINVLITSLGGLNDQANATASLTNILSGNFVGLAKDAEKAGGANKLLKSSLKGASEGVISITKASLTFLATPIGAVIGAIGLALGLVVNALTSTQEGMDKVTAVTRPLTAVLEVLFGIVQKIGLGIINAFSNPLESIEKVYNYVKDKVIKQFTALFDIIAGIATLDFDRVEKGLSGVAENVKDAYNDVAGAVKSVGDEIQRGIELGKQLDVLTKEYERTQIRNAELLPKLNAELKEQNKISEDVTKSQAEREKAAVRTLELSKQINEAKKQELSLELAIAQNQADRNDTSREDELAIAEIKGKIAESDAQRAEIETTQQNKLNTIRKDAIAQQQKAVDKQITKQKELLDLFIAEQGVKARTLSEELKLEEQASERRKEILKAELNAKKISQEAYQTQVLNIDAELGKKRAELVVENALREVEANKRGLELQRENAEFLSAELAEARKQENNNILLQEQELAKLKLEQGLINQQEFDTAIRELSETNRLLNKEIDDERKQLEKEEQAELRALEFEEELLRLQEQGATKFELEQAQRAEQNEIQLQQLQSQRDNALISEELFQSKRKSITDKYNRDKAKFELANEKALAEQRINIANSLFSALSGIIDKNSSFGKALAVSQALINTYKGITSALSAPFPASIPAVITATTTGFKAVKDIVSTKVPKAEGGTISGGGSTPSVSSATSELSSLASNQSNLTQVAGSGNVAVQNQIQQSAQASGLSDNVANAVREGARQGTATGSEQGLTNLSDNKQIQNLSSF